MFLIFVHLDTSSSLLSTDPAVLTLRVENFLFSRDQLTFLERTKQKGLKVASKHVMSCPLALQECNVLMIVVNDSRLSRHQRTECLRCRRSEKRAPAAFMCDLLYLRIGSSFTLCWCVAAEHGQTPVSRDLTLKGSACCLPDRFFFSAFKGKTVYSGCSCQRPDRYLFSLAVRHLASKSKGSKWSIPSPCLSSNIMSSFVTASILLSTAMERYAASNSASALVRSCHLLWEDLNKRKTRPSSKTTKKNGRLVSSQDGKDGDVDFYESMFGDLSKKSHLSGSSFENHDVTRPGEDDAWNLSLYDENAASTESSRCFDSAPPPSFECYGTHCV